MSTERDSHFQGFAKTLWDELMAVTDGYIDVSSDGMDNEWIEQYKAIIARRAYDLMYSTIEFMRYSPYRRSMDISSTETWVRFIPDMDKWPE